MGVNTDSAGVRIPPPVLTLLHLLAAFLLGWLVPLALPAPGWIPFAGWLIVLGGLALGFWALMRFRQAGTSLDPHGQATNLVTDGPYRFSRNPIYVCYLCLLVGFPLVLRIYWGLILVPVLVILMNRLVIAYEEAYLTRCFGEAYLAFKAKVRRWL